MLQVPAHFQFLPKPGQDASHKPWLFIEPEREMIMPGMPVTAYHYRHWSSS